MPDGHGGAVPANHSPGSDRLGECGFIDAHHHVWFAERLPYKWMTGDRAALAFPHGFSDWQKVSSPHALGSVLVQGEDRVEESSALLRIAGSASLPTVVTGWVDASSVRSAAEGLDQLLAHPTAARLRGLRIQTVAELRVLESPTISRRLNGWRLVIELLADTRTVNEVLRSREGLSPLVIDHCARPFTADRATWRHLMIELAAHDDAYVKVSGLMSESGGPGSERGASQIVTELFRSLPASRLMFGSDWPVASLGVGYDAWRRLVAEAAAQADLVPDERAMLWRGTADSVYRMPWASR